MKFSLGAEQEPRRDETDTPAGAGEAVGSVAQLTAPEQMVLRAIRLWMRGPGHHWQIRSLFGEAAPVTTRDLHRAFEAFMCNAAVSLNQQFRRHMPCCPNLGQDEALLLAVIRHAGAGHHTAATAHAQMLIHQDRVEPVTEAAAWLGEQMSQISATTRRQAQTFGPRAQTLH